MKDKPRKVTMRELLDIFDVDGFWEIEPINMGWCKDGCTRWYLYCTPDDKEVYYVKH